MTVSPIKTVLRNVSGNRYSFNLGIDKRVTLLPAGGPCDKVVLNGDIFSQFREGRESDTLIYGIVRNEIVVSYIVEPIYEISLSDNCLQASTSNLTAIYQKWAQSKQGHKDDVAKEPVAPVVEKEEEKVPVKVEVKPEPVSSVTIEPVDPVVEEPVKEEESKVVEEFKVEEVKVTEEPVTAPTEQVSEPVAEEKKEEESVKEIKKEPTTEEVLAAKKRTRRVKLN